MSNYATPNITIRNGLLFNGLQVDSMNLVAERSIYESHTIGDPNPLVIPGSYGLNEAELSFICADRARFDLVAETFEYLLRHEPTFYNLGSGRVCAGCGNYEPGGVLVCRRCGTPTVVRDQVKLVRQQSPFVVTSFNSGASAIGEGRPIVVQATLRLMEPIICSRHSDSYDIFGDLVSPSQGFSLPQTFYNWDGYYVCAYCGNIVREGKICPGCQGVRLPLQEVIDVEKECIYCSRTTKGGIVCEGCAAPIQALVLKDYLNRRSNR